MQLNFIWKGRYYSLCVGHGTPWFSQIYWLTFMEEFHDNKKHLEYITHANLIFHAF